jgi:hypothetical protein
MQEDQPAPDNSSESLCARGNEGNLVVFAMFALLAAYLVGVLCGALAADPWGLFNPDEPWHIAPPAPHTSSLSA